MFCKYLSCIAGTAFLLSATSHARAESFTITPLVTNDQAAHPAQIDDPNLVNAWGISFNPTGPFWVSDNGSGKTTLYSVNPATNATAKQGLVVSIPGDGTITGQAFNPARAGTTNFNADPFLFVSEDGTVSGWRAALGTTAETFALASSANVYKGAALAGIGSDNYLYAANFRAGSIDTFKGNGGAPALTGSFTDPSLPAGYAPFNIEMLNGKLYVTFALQDATKHDEIAGPGNGFVDAFDLQGNFLGRVASNGTLDAPWGMAIAPSSFGSLAGDLLVGNFGDGRINAFNLATDTFDGQLSGPGGMPLVIDGLWGLTVGNGGRAGSSQKIYFAAGPNGESNGLFGVIDTPEPASIAVLGIGLVGLASIRRRRIPMI